MDTKIIGARIRFRRKELKITQANLAASLGCANNYLSTIENGNQIPSLPLFIKICKQLNVTPNYLLLGTTNSQDVPRNIIDKLTLCTPADISLIECLVEYMVQKNTKAHSDSIWRD